jgi:predicted dehydrogenase
MSNAIRSSKIGIGLIGYGYWGPNLVRNFAEVPSTEIRGVCDLSPDRLALFYRRYPLAKATSDYRELLSDPSVDAVAIATPVSSHFELGMQALAAGKHVLIEKPLAASSEQVLRLMEEAERRNRVLMVDHTFVYTGAVRKIKELVTAKTLGDIYYYDSVRVNLGLFQHDVSVLWDLAVHDLSIMDAVLPARPCAVSATGISHIQGNPENTAYLTLFFNNVNLIGHIHVNWLAPVKLRRTLIGASQKMIVYDDVEPSEKVKVYDKGITFTNGNNLEKVYKMLIEYRAGEVWIPKLEGGEALFTEAQHFISCVNSGSKPVTDGECGLRIVQILEAATLSMRAHGRPVELDQGVHRVAAA